MDVVDECPRVVGRVHDGQLGVRIGHLAETRQHGGVLPQHHGNRHVTVTVGGDEHGGDRAQPEHLITEIVRDPPGDHPAERVPQDREVLATHPLSDLRLHGGHDVLSARHVADGAASVTREVEVEATPGAGRPDGRIEGQQQAVIDAEPVEEDQRCARSPLDDVQALTVATGSEDGSRRCLAFSSRGRGDASGLGAWAEPGCLRA
jgi:hypothetical protein